VPDLSVRTGDEKPDRIVHGHIRPRQKPFVIPRRRPQKPFVIPGHRPQKPFVIPGHPEGANPESVSRPTKTDSGFRTACGPGMTTKA
jgi:hypothetical protein